MDGNNWANLIKLTNISIMNSFNFLKNVVKKAFQSSFFFTAELVYVYIGIFCCYELLFFLYTSYCISCHDVLLRFTMDISMYRNHAVMRANISRPTKDLFSYFQIRVYKEERDLRSMLRCCQASTHHKHQCFSLRGLTGK